MSRIVSLEALEAKIGRTLGPEELKEFELLNALYELAQKARALETLALDLGRVDVAIASEAMARACADLIGGQKT